MLDYHKQGHCVYFAEYHLVLVTKYRIKIFNKGIKEYLKDILKRISEYYPEIAIKELNTDQDHVHLLVSIPPKIAVSQAVNIIKSNSAKALKTKFEFIRNVYNRHKGFWSDGYFVSTVGIKEEVIKKYIQRQGQEDSGQAKLEL